MDRDEPTAPVVSLAAGRARRDVEERAAQDREPGPVLRGGSEGRGPRLRLGDRRADAGRGRDALERGQGALQILWHLQAAGARRARQEDRRLLLHGAHQGARRRRLQRRRSGRRSTTPPRSSPTARCASRRGRASSTTTSTARKLAPLVRHLNRHYRDAATLGACGDVNRNVMCSPIEGLDPEHADGRRRSSRSAIAEELAPRIERLLPGLPVRRGGPQRWRP